MSIFYFTSSSNCLRCFNNSYKSLGSLRILNSDSITKSINRHISSESSENNAKETPILNVHSTQLDTDHKLEPNINNYVPSYNSIQIRKLIIENHSNMDMITLFRNASTLNDSFISDTDIVSILSERLVSNLNKVKDYKLMLMFLKAMRPSSKLKYEFFEKVVNHIYENKLYPNINNPRQWTTYFQFFGNNKILHTNLYNELLEIYIKYLDLYLNNDNEQVKIGSEIENKPILNKRFQESIATVSWCLCISGIRNDEFIDKVLKIIDKYYLLPSIIIRIYWTLAILGTRLNEISLDTINQLLQQELNNDSLHKKSHINQLHAILMSIKLFNNKENGLNDKDSNVTKDSDINIDELIDQCLINLTKFGYHNSGKMISKSQKLISDFLIRSNIPHQFEVTTDELISIDILITLDDEKIALEVDGPVHFLKNLDDPTCIRKTEPCLHKEKILTKLGWTYISVPIFFALKDQNFNMQKIDEYYKSILLKYNCTKLNKLLNKSN